MPEQKLKPRVSLGWIGGRHVLALWSALVLIVLGTWGFAEFLPYLTTSNLYPTL